MRKLITLSHLPPGRFQTGIIRRCIEEFCKELCIPFDSIYVEQKNDYTIEIFVATETTTS